MAESVLFKAAPLFVLWILGLLTLSRTSLPPLSSIGSFLQTLKKKPETKHNKINLSIVDFIFFSSY